jgi:hypothetical protein
MDYAAHTRKQVTATSKGFMVARVRHSWPRKVRELQEFIELSVILTSGGLRRLLLHMLCFPLPGASSGVGPISEEDFNGSVH